MKSVNGMPTSPYYYSSTSHLKSLLTSIEVSNAFARIKMSELDNWFVEFSVNSLKKMGDVYSEVGK